MSASESIPRGAIFVWIFIVLAVIFECLLLEGGEGEEKEPFNGSGWTAANHTGMVKVITIP